ncbi:MAG: BlaI/MecI/CopY family transcriptional regulator [Simkaniaceae bacterium]
MSRKQDFGALENQIFQAVAALKKASVHDVQTALAEDKAYTTVMTVLNRLVDKGLLKKNKSGRLYLYEIRQNKSAIKQHFLQRIKKWLLHIRPKDLLCHFLETEHISEQEILELEKMLKKYRKEHYE